MLIWKPENISPECIIFEISRIINMYFFELNEGYNLTKFPDDTGFSANPERLEKWHWVDL